ncbi:ADP-ribosylglycohydrolase [Caldicoprobacter guelmensis]|uniref:ADP-ribosylglycohydrolase family protein n=1 Tax=Caldicoprobacter guelmensis TaxID=1170224 RepID=UPI00195C7AF0|nr:ADP-ribosylglycohydrolase family protein [Caldicoprobacter guelmensis]MBM7582962.1 ADP-ribosylglycohydrolase [Caldicoprobacter guelmensis]
MIKFKDRVRGVVLGIAYGDALGAPVEKLSYEEIKKKYGRVNTLNTKWYKADLPANERLYRMKGNGIVTDDTLMTLSLINVYCIKKRHLDAYDLADEFIKEIAFRPKYIPEFGREAFLIERLFYPEKYLFLRHALANCNPREGGIGNMVNCGAAMYIAPVGVVNACDPMAAYNEAISFAMGHQSSYGLEAAGVLAACVAKAFEPDVDISDIIQTALNCAKDGTKKAIEEICNAALKLRKYKDDKDLVVKEFHKIMSYFSPMGDDVNKTIEKVGIPSNYYTPNRLFSIEELPIALGYITLHDGDFQNSVIDGINSGRDTDSIGVMIGAILGAKHGYKVISKEDIETLEKVNKLNLIEAADRFAEVAQYIIQKDLELWEKKKDFYNKLGLGEDSKEGRLNQ